MKIKPPHYHMAIFSLCPKRFQKRSLIRQSLAVILFIAFSGFVSLTPCQAVEPEKKSDTVSDKQDASAEEYSEADLKERIKTLEKRLEPVTALVNGVPPPDAGLTLPELQEYETRLLATLSTLQRIENAKKKKQGLDEEQHLLKKKLETGQYMDISEKPPFSLSFYNTLLDTGDALLQQKESITAAISLSKRTLEEAAISLEEMKKQVRQMKDQRSIGKEAPKTVSEAMILEAITSHEELASATLVFERIKNQSALKESEIIELKIAILDRRKSWVEERVAYDEEDLKKQRQSLSGKKDQLKNSLVKLAEEQKEIERAWMRAQQALSEEKNPDNRSLKELEAAEKETRRKACQSAIEFTEDRLRLLEYQEQNWQNRYTLLKKEVDQRVIKEWKERAVSRINEINRTIHLQQRYQLNTQAQIIGIEKMITDQTESSMRAILSRHVNALRRLSERSVEYVTALIETLQQTERLVHEIDRRIKILDLSHTIQTVKTTLHNIWNFEVWVIDDRPVTIKKLFVGIIIFFLGVTSSKRVIRIFWRRVSKYANFRENTAKAIEKVLFYFTLFLIILLVLRIVNIPLGAFAFFGGAIAIGIGFGAQNLINNFISGFIIMIEQPIRVGDLIEIDGFIGQVEEIGARCTRIRTGDNLHILVPNSGFLEKNIVNWTIVNNRVRASVNVGVSYGSPVEKVRDLLIQCASDHERILNNPKPFILFKEFADSALNFTLYFWVNIEQMMEKSSIESDIRFIIDKAFLEAGIVIAFPQMDVHLDTTHPLTIKWDERDK